MGRATRAFCPQLAFLSAGAISQEEFWSTLTAQTLCSEVPALFAEVVCVGYPTGGDNLCVTKARREASTSEVGLWSGPLFGGKGKARPEGCAEN